MVANAKGDSGSSTRSSVAVPPGQETILRPDQVEASSSSEVGEDAGHNPIRYDAQNVADGDPQTTWRTPGDGRGESVTLRWNRSVHITSIGLIPGYAKTDPYDGTDRFAQERRIAQATYAFGDGTRVVARFTNSREPQFSSTNVDADSVTIQIDQTTPHHGRDFTAISEVIVKGAG